MDDNLNATSELDVDPLSSSKISVSIIGIYCARRKIHLRYQQGHFIDAFADVIV